MNNIFIFIIQIAFKFSEFINFILSGKNGKSPCKVLGYSTSNSRNLLQEIYIYFIIVFYKLFIKFFSIQNHLRVIFETLLMHTNCWHHNTEYLMILHFCHGFSYRYYLLLHIYVLSDIFHL